MRSLAFRFSTVLTLALSCSVSVIHAQQTPCFSDIPEMGPLATVQLTFDHVYTGSYRPGESYDTVTIRPDGRGETFEGLGISLRLQVTCGDFDQPIGPPLAGIPAEQVVLYSSLVHFCSPKYADHETDAEGWTEFTGTIAGGGCAPSLDLYVDGVFQRTLPIRINSTDTGSVTPGFTDEGDLAALAERLGVRDAWDICFDYNESGAPIDASDLAYFAAALGGACH